MAADAPSDIPITRYPAARGGQWLREAFAMFSQARAPWLLLLLTYYIVMGIVDLVPVIGQIAVPVLKPVFAVGFLAAAWGQERGRRPQLGELFQGFRANLGALVLLGIVLLVGASAAIFATALVDGGTLLDVLSGKTAPDEDALATGRLQAAMLFGAACALPVLLALWYAPALVVFHGCNAPRALLLSLRASLVNWQPLAVYGLLVVFYAVVVPGLVMAIIGIVVPTRIAFGLALLLMMPYLLFVVATLHISDYVSYRDIFHAGEKAAAPAAG